ncbi:hypothetical protein ABZ816_35760 [Actinosynnema sp. NPDC047251]|uniref:hypothetical protein n=1 Tax=Saccharothrix espanaensis TaxID=103731 RepID=UPI0011DDC81F|nr:hypothetical protein [Saccharothrix espanaensis]
MFRPGEQERGEGEVPGVDGGELQIGDDAEVAAATAAQRLPRGSEDADRRSGRLDREAHETFLHLTPAPVIAYDENGQPATVTHSERLTEITRRARFIAVSDTLTRAVAALLVREGVRAEVGHVQVQPAAEGDEQVLGLHITINNAHAVVPIRPGTPQLRAYPAIDHIDLTGHQPLLTIDLPHEAIGQDGWIAAETITTALIERLHPPIP